MATRLDDKSTKLLLGKACGGTRVGADPKNQIPGYVLDKGISN